MKTLLTVFGLLGVVLAMLSIYGIYNYDWSFIMGWSIAIPSVALTAGCCHLMEGELKKR